MNSTIAKRFSTKYQVNGNTGCWDWTASKNIGYGQIGAGGKNGKPLFAHRVSYELHKGPIPKHLVIDHICRNRGCVNPDHLRVVTRLENVMCGMSLPALKKHWTSCPRGHEYKEENIYWFRGHRCCRQCRKINEEKRSRPSTSKRSGTALDAEGACP